MAVVEVFCKARVHERKERLRVQPGIVSHSMSRPSQQGALSIDVDVEGEKGFHQSRQQQVVDERCEIGKSMKKPH